MSLLWLESLNRWWRWLEYSLYWWVMVVVGPNRVSSVTANPHILETLETTVGHGLFVKLKVQVFLVLAAHMFVRPARTVWRLPLCPSQVLCSWGPRPFTD
jgi:hypothetical protein